MKLEGTYEIEYATAHVEAVMAKAQAAMEILLDGPDSRNSHVARAVQLILDDHIGPLEHRMKELEEAVLKHHQNPENRQVPESQPMFADRIQELTRRYDRHMTTRFPKDMKHTEQSVFYTLTITPVVINRALQHLNAEIITREPGDQGRLGYISALKEVAAEIPRQKEVLALCQNRDQARNDRQRRFLKQAQAAAEDNERLTTLYGPPSTGNNSLDRPATNQQIEHPRGLTQTFSPPKE